MANAVTVFVDDAVLGRLPSICVKDGVFTEDRVIQRLQIGDRSLGTAWLLVFFGPVGWIVLIGIALTRRPVEVLRVVLPLSEAARLRELAAVRAFRAYMVLGVLGAAGLLMTVVMPGNGGPALGLLLGLATVATLAGGVIGMFVANTRVKGATVELDLDASRRWVTIWRVHADFAAQADRQAVLEADC